MHNNPLAYVDPDGQFAFLIPIAISLAIDYCVSLALPYALECFGPGLTTSFVAGMASGYCDTFSSAFNSATYAMGALDPSTCICNRAGLALGTMLALGPNKIFNKGFQVAGNLAIKEATGAVAATVEKKAITEITKQVSSSTTKKVADVGGQKLIKKATPSLDSLSKAGQVMDRGGLTKAGRALDKHGSRLNAVFPKATGNVASKNLQGQFHLDDIITNPLTVIKPNKFGGFNYYTPDGRGVCFLSDNTFRGFLKP